MIIIVIIIVVVVVVIVIVIVVAAAIEYNNRFPYLGASRGLIRQLIIIIIVIMFMIAVIIIVFFLLFIGISSRNLSGLSSAGAARGDSEGVAP